MTYLKLCFNHTQYIWNVLFFSRNIFQARTLNYVWIILQIVFYVCVCFLVRMDIQAFPEERVFCQQQHKNHWKGREEWCEFLLPSYVCTGFNNEHVQLPPTSIIQSAQKKNRWLAHILMPFISTIKQVKELKIFCHTLLKVTENNLVSY